MPLRTQFILIFVTFSIILTTMVGWMGSKLSSAALEEMLDEQLERVAGTAAAVGLDGEELETLIPGDEDKPTYTGHRARLDSLRARRYVEEAYVFSLEMTEEGRPENTRALVSTGDEVAIGTQVWAIRGYTQELREAWEGRTASTDLIEPEDSEGETPYKYGFVRLGDSQAMLAVRMSADYLVPVKEFQRTVLFSLGVATLFAAVLAGLMALTVTRPLARLSQAARRIEEGRMTQPVHPELGVELGRLSRAMERMRRGIASRDEQLRLMLAQVAHEIRNPLEGLELFAAAAQETRDPQEKARLLRRIRSEVTGLGEIITDFLTFARPAEGAEVPEDVRPPIREAVALVEPEVKKRGGALEVSLPRVPLLARAATDQVKRVTLNLLRNAAQAGRSVQVSAEEEGDEIVISVRDDGPGVSPELRDRIFEPFVTDRPQGAGLGLAIVRRLAEANGGRVELMETPEPRLGTGAEFRVYLRGPDGVPGMAVNEERRSRER